MKKQQFTKKELEAIYDVISSFNAKDIQKKVYYNIEEKLGILLKETGR